MLPVVVAAAWAVNRTAEVIEGEVESVGVVLSQGIASSSTVVSAPVSRATFRWWFVPSL